LRQGARVCSENMTAECGMTYSNVYDAVTVRQTAPRHRWMSFATLAAATLTFLVVGLLCLAPAQSSDKAVGHTAQSSEKAVGHTHAFFLLDRTGSMASMGDAVRQGFNSYLKSQQQLNGKMRLTLVQFDSEDPCEVVIEAADIHSVQPLETFEPRAQTPLYDAIAKTIALAKSSVRADETVALIVFTDGAENASREFDRSSIFKLIEERKAAGWTFIFLGANQDSYAAGGNLGYSQGATSNFAATAAGAKAAFSDLSTGSIKWRGDVSAGVYTRAKASNWMSGYTSRQAEAHMNGA